MKNLLVGIKIFLFFTLLTGVIYPALVTGIAQLFFTEKANGSLILKDNKIVGSELISQSFKHSKYFWPRPSAIDFNPLPSGGSNLGPTSKDLRSKVEERKAQGLTHELLFASGSGLDPHITKEAAISQIVRVATARGLTEEALFSLVNRVIEPRQMGYLGEPRINVLKLNLELDNL